MNLSQTVSTFEHHNSTGQRWIKISRGASIPEIALYKNGKFNGCKVYVGKVFDGKYSYIGTAVPDKGICIYLNKSNQLRASPNYEILTGDVCDPLEFFNIDLDNNIFVAGVNDSEEIYVGRYIDNYENTYYGWISKNNRLLHIPRHPNSGPQIVDKDYEVLIHKFLVQMGT